MKPDEAPAFFKILDVTFDLIGKSAAAKVISAEAKAMFFNDLKRYPLEYIEAALQAHRMDADRGRFTPTVADIASQIERRRPMQWVSADEAWAAAPKLENQPAIVNSTVVQALATAQPLMDAGDMVAARMAFKGTYERLVAMAKLDRRGPEYFLSPGGTFEEQQAVIDQGQMQGLLPRPDGQPQSLLGPATPSKAGKARIAALLQDLKPKIIGSDDE
jgi:hypothetical protein